MKLRKFVYDASVALLPLPGIYAAIRLADGHGHCWHAVSFCLGLAFAMIVVVPIAYRLHDWSRR